MLKKSAKLALCLATLFCVSLAFSNPRNCGTQFRRLLSGADYAGVDELNQHIDTLGTLRKLIFEEEHKPYQELIALAPLLNKRDKSLQQLGQFKKIKEQKWDPQKGNHSVNVDVFEFQSGKETLLIKLPVDKDRILVSTNTYNPSFYPRDISLIQREQWKGRPVLLIGPLDKLTFLSASQGTPTAADTSTLNQIADMTEKIGGDVSKLLDHPAYYLKRGFDVTLRAPLDEELKLTKDLLTALGHNTQKMGDDLSQMILAREKDYRRMSLEFILAHKLPSAKDFEVLAKIETKKRNGIIEFGDGDLFIRLLSEKPYRLWLKESEGHEYVIERSSVNAKETLISFGSPKKVKGSVQGTAQSFKESGTVETYPIGRLKFPLELIQVRLDPSP